MEKKWITVYKYFDVLEGQRLEGALKKQNIPVMNISRQDSAFDGIFGSAIGAGVLRVREDFLEQAKEIIALFEAEQRELGRQSHETWVSYERKNSISTRKIFSRRFSFALAGIFVILFITIAFGLGKKYYYKYHPNSAKSILYSDRGKAFLEQRRYKEAVGELKKAVLFNPSSALALARLGYAYLCLEQYQEAVTYYQKAIAVNPNEYKHYGGLGAAYGGLRWYHNGISALEKSIKLQQKNPYAYADLAGCYIGLGDYATALAKIDEALKYDPNNFLAYFYQAEVYYRTKEFNKMIEAVQKEIELRPDYARGYLDAGIAYYRLSKYKEATEQFKKALNIDPRDAYAHYYLGSVYKATGDTTSMRKECDTLIRMGKGEWAETILGIKRKKQSSYSYPSRL
jgi:tetratricopeptide (TPR) repeat protein